MATATQDGNVYSGTPGYDRAIHVLEDNGFTDAGRVLMDADVLDDPSARVTRESPDGLALAVVGQSGRDAYTLVIVRRAAAQA